MTAPSLKIFFHDRCFDGAASAAIFANFYRDTRKPKESIVYCGMSHSQGDPFQEVAIDGQENACLDFRYTAHPRMNWWFDHHQSGFQPPSLRQHFEANRTGQKFFDPLARSCAVFTEQVLRSHFDFRAEDPEGHWAQLSAWADKIDGALFTSAAEIVELGDPALQLMEWLKNNRDPQLSAKLIESMGRRSLGEIVTSPWVQATLPTLLEAHRRSVDLVAGSLQFDGLVASYDLSEHMAIGSGFAAYMLEPACVYSIGLSRSAQSVAISLGRNPWAGAMGERNLAHICERYGGGGHAHVGGITMPDGELARAREIVEEIRLALHQEE